MIPLFGADEVREKSQTTTEIVAAWVREPLVPVTVKVEVPV
jgi:hypothetical protein